MELILFLEFRFENNFGHSERQYFLITTLIGETRRERLKSALYLRLKKSKVLKYVQDVFMKSSEKSFETPKGCLSSSIRFGNHFLPKWEKNFGFFSLGKCRLVPKIVKAGTLWDLLTYIQLQNIKNLEGETLLRH